MLTLSRRPCSLSPKHSGDVKNKNGKQYRLLTFGIDALLLDRTEFNALLGDAHAWDALFNVGVEPIEPMLKSIKQLELKYTVDDALVVVEFEETHRELVFTKCELKKIKLTLLQGGRVSMSCKITTAPALDRSLAELIERFGHTAECGIRADLPTEQPDLPLNRFGGGEQPAAH